MKRFVFDVIVDAENICNLEQERLQIQRDIDDGRRIVVSGRRNTGKTSLIRSIIQPYFEKKHPQSFVLFADLMGVHHMDEICERLHLAFEKALAKAFPKQSHLKTLTNILKGLRPTASIDPLTGELSFSLHVSTAAKKITLDTIFENIIAMQQHTPVLLIFDEFQDIAMVPSAQAHLRRVMQNLASHLPVIILGSKRHLLAKIFGAPGSPLAGWGKDIIIPTIEHPTYRRAYEIYVNERLAPAGLSLSSENIDYLLSLVDSVPEPANIICDQLLRTKMSHPISRIDIGIAFNSAVSERQGRFEQRLTHYRDSEKTLLIALAKHGPVAKVKGKDFLKTVPNLSPSSVFGLARKLEDTADIENTAKGYIVADPLLAQFLRNFR